MMARRVFLKFLGGGVAAAPAAAKTMADMSLASVGVATPSIDFPSTSSDCVPASSSDGWAHEALSKLGGARQEHHRRFIRPTRMEPGIVSLRSVSLTHKVEMQKDFEVAFDETRERSYLMGVIAGVFS